jgi:hypothetical protein
MLNEDLRVNLYLESGFATLYFSLKLIFNYFHLKFIYFIHFIINFNPNECHSNLYSRQFHLEYYLIQILHNFLQGLYLLNLNFI